MSSTFTLPKFTDEQMNVVEQVKLGKNIKVDSVPGSGKTSTILAIVKYSGLERILCLTYSKHLKEDCRRKGDLIGMSNVLEAHSFHSFGVKYFSPKCSTKITVPWVDQLKPQKKIPNYDLIVIDEIQDMTQEIYQFVQYSLGWIEDGKWRGQLCLLGDKDQCVFRFKNADFRYLTLGQDVFSAHPQPDSTSQQSPPHSREWVDLKLTYSFRLTPEISQFVNQQLVGYQKVKSGKFDNQLGIAPKVNYVRGNPFEDTLQIGRMIGRLKTNQGYQDSDFFVLWPSVKSKNPNHPLSKLERFLIDQIGCRLIVQKNDEVKLEPEDMKGKLVFATFHASKGLERKAVFVMGFEHNYFRFYGRRINPYVCPSTIYVACTRAQEYLTVFEGNNSRPLLFIKPDKMIGLDCRYARFVNLKESRPQHVSERKPIIGVTDLVKYLPENLVDRLMARIELTEIQAIIEPKISCQVTVQFGGIYENVSALYGTSIPLLTHVRNHGSEKLVTYLRDYLKTNQFDRYLEPMEKAVKSCFSQSNPSSTNNPSSAHLTNTNKLTSQQFCYDQFMFLANLYHLSISHYIHQLEQMTDYNWVNGEALEQGMERLDNFVGELNLMEEEKVKTFQGTDVYGVVDALDKQSKILWEFKFVDQLTNEHVLQLVVYAWLLGLDLAEYSLLLFNVKSNQIIKISEINNIDLIVGKLIEQRMENQEQNLEDGQFLSRSRKERLNCRRASRPKIKLKPKRSRSPSNRSENTSAIQPTLLNKQPPNIADETLNKANQNPSELNQTQETPHLSGNKTQETHDHNRNQTPLNKPKRVIVFDTETTGIKPTDRVIELAWLVYDLEEKRLIEENQFLFQLPANEIKMDEYRKAEKFHQISYQKLMEDGVDPTRAILQFLRSVESADLLVGHNIRFDLTMLKSELRRHGIDNRRLKQVPTQCTMEMMKDWVSKQNTETLPSFCYQNGGKLKDRISLGDSLKLVCQEEINGWHRALTDTRYTLKLFLNLIS